MCNAYNALLFPSMNSKVKILSSVLLFWESEGQDNKTLGIAGFWLLEVAKTQKIMENYFKLIFSYTENKSLLWN